MIEAPRWASRFVGIPFKVDGLDRRGCHCWGLVRLVLKERAGFDLPAYAEYNASDLLRAAKLFAASAKSDEWREVAAPYRALDCVLMTAMSGRVRIEGHVGVLVTPFLLLHVWEATAAVLMPLDHPLIKTKILGVYRYRNLA
ncbi:hypothetical protein [Bradyrhizobium sp. G127]|uniref:hypothetical protein n=1 Tax=Bradyrhizobium sp. G127 TaxID=2904800 RepID=UPI001F186C0D|nr:hypothetical protein [Bradyrhizobium sp. G127]MCF2522351.1 hypothetical protein [Bradyrhizobium sp. G127]